MTAYGVLSILKAMLLLFGVDFVVGRDNVLLCPTYAQQVRDQERGVAIQTPPYCFGSWSSWRHVLYALENYYAETNADLDDVWTVARCAVSTNCPCSSERSTVSTYVQLCPMTNSVSTDEPMWTPRWSSSMGSWHRAILQMLSDIVSVLSRRCHALPSRSFPIYSGLCHLETMASLGMVEWWHPNLRVTVLLLMPSWITAIASCYIVASSTEV